MIFSTLHSNGPHNVDMMAYNVVSSPGGLPCVPVRAPAPVPGDCTAAGHSQGRQGKLFFQIIFFFQIEKFGIFFFILFLRGYQL